MNRERQQTLVTKYPKLFRDYGGDFAKTCMAGGIECRDGWYDIIDALCAVMAEDDPEVVLLQVKEKFGTLRVYVGGGSERTDACVRMAEMLSGRVCEGCGARGSIREYHGWWRTECKECSNKRMGCVA